MTLATAGRPSARRALGTRHQLLLTVLLTSFVAACYGFGFYLFAQLVTDMRTDLGFGYTAVGVITAGGQFGFMLFALAGAWAAHRYGGGQKAVSPRNVSVRRRPAPVRSRVRRHPCDHAPDTGRRTPSDRRPRLRGFP